MTEDLRPPYRIAFDTARDPYAARNALGILGPGGTLVPGGGGGSGAPLGAQYIVAAADPTLTAERVLTNTATITWDFTTPGQAKASTAVGGGNVSNSGTPTAGQYAKWVTATTIQGVAPAMVLADIGAQPAGSYQPLDGDLTAIAALTGTNTIYYRSAADTWTAVTIGANLTFTGGTLAATGGGAASGITFAPAGNIAATNVQAAIQELDSEKVAKAGDTMTGVLQMPPGSNAAPSINFGGSTAGISGASTLISFSTQGTQRFQVTGNDTQVFNRLQTPAGSAGSAAIHFGNSDTGFYGGADIRATVGGNNKLTLNATGLTATVPITLPADPTTALQAATKQMVDGKQPLDGDLTAIAALAGTNVIYYRSAADTWSAVTIGTGLTFTGGTLTATGGGTGNVSNSGTPVAGQAAEWVTATTIKGVNATPQCGKLAYVGPTVLSFTPFNGDRIKINGATYTIPTAGIAGLGNTGVRVNNVPGQNLVANTTYWVFAENVAGTITGHFWTVAGGLASPQHRPSQTAGNEGLETWYNGTELPQFTLIGIIRTNASAQFVDTPLQRYVRSWYNRQRAHISSGYLVWGPAGSTVPSSTGQSFFWVQFAGEAVLITASGTGQNNVTSQNNSLAMYLDGSGISGLFNSSTNWAANIYHPIGFTQATSPSEGDHTVTLMYFVSGGGFLGQTEMVGALG